VNGKALYCHIHEPLYIPIEVTEERPEAVETEASVRRVIAEARLDKPSTGNTFPFLGVISALHLIV
jgi:hypothetical protein